MNERAQGVDAVVQFVSGERGVGRVDEFRVVATTKAQPKHVDIWEAFTNSVL
jgi:hypothetical protein